MAKEPSVSTPHKPKMKDISPPTTDMKATSISTPLENSKENMTTLLGEDVESGESVL